MAIYRHEQARLSISSEIGDGGYLERCGTMGISTVKPFSSSTENLKVPSGATKELKPGTNFFTLLYTSTPPVFANLELGDYLIIGVPGINSEIRRVVNIDNLETNSADIYLDYPLGLYHTESSDETIRKLKRNSNTGRLEDSAAYSIIPGVNLSTFLPGVYETIQCPDLVPELMPKYYLKEKSDRNWSYMYRGRLTFNGSVPDMILLNGFPLQYAMGKSEINQTIVSLKDTTAIDGTIESNVLPGSIQIKLSDSTFPAGLEIATSSPIYHLIMLHGASDTKPREIRRIVATNSTDKTITLNYPLFEKYSTNDKVTKISAANVAKKRYVHRIKEESELPSMTWNLTMHNSTEDPIQNFTRKYVGGIVNRATISANEGEVVTFGLDDVQFLSFLHNQTRVTNPNGSNQLDVEYSTGGLIDVKGIGGAVENADGKATYPENQPFYFSEGTVKFFGVPFARIRNFRLEINNNVEARYYISNNTGVRGPSEFQEQHREYTMSATLAMNDSAPYYDPTRSIWKELILEGNYQGYGKLPRIQGFDIEIVFTRGDAKIVMKSPIQRDGTSLEPSPEFEGQGCFFRSATHNIGQESPIQAEGEIILHNLGIEVEDDQPIYP